MINCLLCKKPLKAGPNNGFEHFVCFNEHKRREDAGLCCWCGGNLIITDNGIECDSCIYSDEIPRNYNCP